LKEAVKNTDLVVEAIVENIDLKHKLFSSIDLVCIICFETFQISIVVIWVATACGLVDGYQHFGGTYCLHFQCSSIFLEDTDNHLQVHTVSQLI
jgi:hypothetical protein